MADSVLTAKTKLFFKRYHQGYCQPNLRGTYEKLVAETEQNFPGFSRELRILALDHLQDEDPNMIRCALLALSVVGAEENEQIVRTHLTHGDEKVRTETGTCLFVMRKRK